MAQTSVQNVSAIRLGSVKFEVGASIGALSDLGGLRNAKVSEAFTLFSVKSDNAGELSAGISEQKMTISADWLEPDLAKLYAMRGGIDLYTPAGATPIPITSEVVVMSTIEPKGVRLAHKNSDGTLVTITTIKHITDTPTFAEGTDYIVSIDNEGYTCLARPPSGSTITDGQSVHANYTYTPGASKTLTSGGKKTVGYCVARLTNTNSVGKTLILTLYKCRITKGLDSTFLADDGTEPNSTAIEIEAVVDTTRTIGDQLFSYVDEQAP